MKVCVNCKEPGGLVYSEKGCIDGTWRIRVFCEECGGHNRFVRMSPPFDLPIQFYIDWLNKTKVNYLKLRLEKTILVYEGLLDEENGLQS